MLFKSYNQKHVKKNPEKMEWKHNKKSSKIDDIDIEKELTDAFERLHKK